MIKNWLDIVTLGAALGSGLMAGIFFAFSNSIMTALSRLPNQQGIAAMQTINIVIVNPLFLLVFLGTAVASLIIIVAAVLGSTSQPIFVLSGGALYLVGSIGLSVAINIPKNDALAAVAPADPTSARLWASYLAGWTGWNHVRTVATLAATVLLILALI